MSFLYRPTPVFNPGPSTANLSGAVSGGVMRGYDPGVNWKAFFDAQRAAPQGQPWITKSGTMGSFVLDGMGDALFDPTSLDTPSFDPAISPAISIDPLFSGSLPLTPYSADPALNPISNYGSLPSSFFNMAPPSAPAIVSSGGSILTPPSAPPAAAPGSPALPGFSWPSVIAPLTSLATSITKAVTGSGGSIPAIAPSPVQASSQIAQAQALQAQANALQNTNPTLAAQYRAQANALLTGAGASGTSSFAQWMGNPSVIPSISNGGLLTIGGAVIFLLALTGTVGYHTGRGK
jgi:hypothetical protein